jgi:DNA-binding NarL/FixJ family response regulator
MSSSTLKLIQTRISVLVVDDQEYIRIILERWLRRAPDMVMTGWLPTTERLEQRLAQEPPSVLVMDYMIPGVDTPALLRTLRQRFPEVAVVVYSSFQEHEVEVMELGAAAFVSKDAGADTLIAAIRTAAQSAA